MLDSFESEEEAIAFSQRVVKSLVLGGFRLNQWISSSRTVLAAIPETERSHPSVNLDLDNLPIERAIGVKWNCQLDNISVVARKLESAKTKREMLAALSSVFDPLGLLSPVTIRAKILFQDTWRSRRKLHDKSTVVNWDEILPPHLHNT